MRTLLSLFFVPYLRFLGKFHLYAIPVMAFVFMVKIQELMVLAPMVYMFSLYATSNRHQFKDNIPWMLSTFNKKTLVRYHLMAQTMVLACQALLSSLTMVLFFATMILVAPETSDQVLPEFTSMPKTGATSVVTKAVSPLAGTKEQLVLAAALIFFLITMYSPVSLKDYLRQMEEKGGKKSMQQQFRDVGLLIAGAGVLILLKPADWLVILLSFIIIAELAYLVWMYNRAFVLFHPRHYKMGGAAAGALAVVMSWGVYQTSLYRFHHHEVPEVRLSELSFMGRLAPEVSPQEFTQLAAKVKDPQFIVELLSRPQFQGLIEETQLKAWVLEAKELGVALRLIKTFPAAKLNRLAEAKVWEHLEKLHADLKNRNPASADWQAKSLERHLSSTGWKPERAAQGPFEKALTQGIQERADRRARLPASSR